MQDGKESVLIDVPDETFADDFGASPLRPQPILHSSLLLLKSHRRPLTHPVLTSANACSVMVQRVMWLEIYCVAFNLSLHEALCLMARWEIP